MLHIHWHKIVRVDYCWIYKECRCGHRKVSYWRNAGYAPLDIHWLHEDTGCDICNGKA